MIVYAEVECMLYEGHSLKQKRSIIKSLIAKVQNTYNVTIAEIDYHDLWQRTKFAIAVVANEYVYAEKVIYKVLAFIDNLSELEITRTNIERL